VVATNAGGAEMNDANQELAPALLLADIAMTATGTFATFDLHS
jgi:hypothetical protein